MVETCLGSQTYKLLWHLETNCSPLCQIQVCWLILYMSSLLCYYCDWDWQFNITHKSLSRIPIKTGGRVDLHIRRQNGLLTIFKYEIEHFISSPGENSWSLCEVMPRCWRSRGPCMSFCFSVCRQNSANIWKEQNLDWVNVFGQQVILSTPVKDTHALMAWSLVLSIIIQ